MYAPMYPKVFTLLALMFVIRFLARPWMKVFHKWSAMRDQNLEPGSSTGSTGSTGSTSSAGSNGSSAKMKDDDTELVAARPRPRPRLRSRSRSGSSRDRDSRFVADPDPNSPQDLSSTGDRRKGEKWGPEILAES